MPKVTGISLGLSEVRVVELDGSSRRYRVTQAFTVPLDSGEMMTDPAENGEGVPVERDRVRALSQVLKEHKVQRDHLGVIVSGRDCLVRNANLAIKGEDQIRKVIKFEAENWFQSVDIDDVVVDFLPVREGEEGTDLIVAAARKAPLQHLLDRFRNAGVDPEVLELDAVALHRVASSLGYINEDQVQILVDMGRTTSRVLLIREGRLEGTRTMRFGLDHYLVPTPPAAEETEGEESSVAAPAPPSPEGVAGYVARLSREITRFLAGFGLGSGPAVGLVSGHGAAVEGVQEQLARVLNLELVEMECWDQIEHDLDEEKIGAVGSTVLPALGVALEMLGVVETGMNFRQEEFQFSRKFERIKFPLAVAMMLLAFALVLVYTKTMRERKSYEAYYGSLERNTKSRSRKYKGLLLPHVWNTRVVPSLDTQKTMLARWMKTVKSFEDPLQAIPWLKGQLNSFKKAEEKRLGFYPDLPPLESSLHALRSFAHIFEEARKSVDSKVIVTKLSLKMLPTTRRKMAKSRRLSFDLLVWGENARGDHGRVTRAFEDAVRVGSVPFAKHQDAGKEELTKNPPGGIWYRGHELTITPRVDPTTVWPPTIK